jgi:hypothetical protein
MISADRSVGRMIDHELWSFNTAILVVIFIVIILLILSYGISKIFDIKHIKNNWASMRCSPTVMPFAGIFGYNTKENFEFCMGKIFNTHSMPYFGSIGTMFSHSTVLLSEVFNSMDSMRNTIASLGGGINVIFQEFTERITNFFFRLRISAIHIKTLIGRMYAILFSVMYMGLSGITGMTSFTNTFLFSFLNTFCFPSDTLIHTINKGKIQIKDICIGDILYNTGSKVTATFKFFARGQPMVKLGSIIVSTNHYVSYLGKNIKAGDHPDAISIGNWESDEPLYCLNTSDNKIPIDEFIFLDYDETSEGDYDTMNYIESRINSTNNKLDYRFKEYSPAIDENENIMTENGIKHAKDVQIGDKLNTGSKVVGLVRKVVNEVCKLDDDTIITPSTLYWNVELNKWERIGNKVNIIDEYREMVSFIVVPNSQIELKNGLRIRDYMELCSPDSEIHYTKCLETTNI